MSNWHITFADNLNDAYRSIGSSKKSILIENNENNSVKVYMANKENVVFIIEEGALGIPPEIQEGMGGIFIGTGYNVFCFDKCLENRLSFSTATPMVGFVFSQKHGLMMVVCEADVYFVNSSFALLGNKSFDDLVDDYKLVGDYLVCKLYEGQEIKVALSEL